MCRHLFDDHTGQQGEREVLFEGSPRIGSQGQCLAENCNHLCTESVRVICLEGETPYLTVWISPLVPIEPNGNNSNKER